MVRRTKLYTNKREVVHSLSEAKTRATKIDAMCLEDFIREVKEIKSSVSLNRKIKQINKVWKSLNLPTY